MRNFEVTQEVILAGRCIRHFLTNKPLEVFSQKKADEAFKDLEGLVAVALPFWLEFSDPEDESDMSELLFETAHELRQKYPGGENTAYKSSL